MKEDLNTQLKILQFIDNYYPQIDGVVKVVDNSTRIMNEICAAKVVAPKYRDKYYDDTAFSYDVLRRETRSIVFNGLEIPLPKKTKELTRYIKNFNADIYHIHSPFFVGRYALKLAKETNTPVVGTFHSQFKKDVLAVTHSEGIASALVKNIVGVFNRCDEVWAPSKSTAEVLYSYGYEKEIFIMENGTDFTYPNDIEKTVDNARALYGIRQEYKNLLFVGQMRDVKNIPLILETFKALSEKDKDYRLYLVGEGSDMPKYRKWVENNGVARNVHFLGKITDREVLAGVYAACDLFFFPSSYDNAPIVVREACVMQTPTLLSRGSVAAEPFVDGVNGYLEEENAEKLQKKIMTIFASKEKMQEVGKRAAEEIPITFDTMVEHSLKRYREIIERHRCGYGK